MGGSFATGNGVCKTVAMTTNGATSLLGMVGGAGSWLGHWQLGEADGAWANRDVIPVMTTRCSTPKPGSTTNTHTLANPRARRLFQTTTLRRSVARHRST